MRYSESRHDNPWPDDMVIHVDQPASLLLLLFVRSAWKLDANGVPPRDSVPDPGSTVPPVALDRHEANARWAADWARAFEVVVPPRGLTREPDAATLRLLDAATLRRLDADADADAHFDTDADFDDLLRAVSVEDFWRQGLDLDALGAWQQTMWPGPPPPGSMGPEHDAVEWLVPVWRSGVRSIVELPFAGYYVERVDLENVVVSRATRADPQLYSIALSTL